MKPRKYFKRRYYLVVIGLVLLILITLYLWKALPIMSGYAAKVMCSCVYVSSRSENSVGSGELGFFPVSKVNVKLSRHDSTVSASVFGLASRKAVYRPDFGCTLVIDSLHQLSQLSLSLNHQSPIDSMAWPDGDRIVDSVMNGVDYEHLRQVVGKSFRETDPERLLRTRAVLVLYKGKIVAEQYAQGFSSSSRFNGWSMAKSITSALVGIFVNERKLDVDAPAPIRQWSADAKKKQITLRHLLQQTSGLDFDESYSGPSDATNMLYRTYDMGEYAASRAVGTKPGEAFNYSGGNTNILSMMLRQQMGDREYHRFPYVRLFHRIGMNSTIIEPDASGTFVGSSYVIATARDWARFGLLYLNKGMWNNEQVLPSDWIEQTVSPAAASVGKYGFQFWLNRGTSTDDSGRRFPSVPADMFFADGYEGQNVFIIPSRELVVVRLGLTRGPYFNEDEFLKEIISCFRN